MRQILKDGTVQDWEELGKQSFADMEKSNVKEVMMFGFNSDDRFLLVLAADMLNVTVSFLYDTLKKIIKNVNEIDKRLLKGKKIDKKLLVVQPRYNSSIDPLPMVCSLLNVNKYEVPERVEKIALRYNELARQAANHDEALFAPPITIPDHALNPFLKVDPVPLTSGLQLSLTSDITADIIRDYRRWWFKGPETKILEHLLKAHADLLNQACPSMKMKEIMLVLVDMANFMYGWCEQKLDNMPVDPTFQELVRLGAVNTKLPPPHLTPLGLSIRHLVLATNPGHLRVLRRLKIRD